MKQMVAAVLLLSGASWGDPALESSEDWPQFMRDSEHRGDAGGQGLRLPLGLATRVQLDDAILASPAVVAGKV